MTRLLRGGVMQAVYEDGQWRAEDSALLRVLNALIDPDGASGADPDPEWTLTRTAAERLGPAWTVEKDTLPPYDPAVRY